ncbi:hypothetical protein B0A55_00352 [Friedmanniomyces simplex]|uniref:Uncharacterized protein n=1 Tax=Friedmanniomyces simplex TaxID=329884 RepID=A0A4U0Y719_9PEZI|nr:hypothetical protein B0A55_00352 [Friedmanniomyces simplex]
MGDVMPAGFRQGARSDGNGIDLGAQFGYHYHEQLDNDLRREPILDLQDTQFVEDFFENPNDPKVAASLSQRADSNLNPSMEDRNSFAVNYTFDQSANAGPINPASTMADSSSINYETHQGTLPFQSDNFQQFGGHTGCGQ